MIDISAIDSATRAMAHVVGMDEGPAALVFCAAIETEHGNHDEAARTLAAALEAWQPETMH